MPSKILNNLFKKHQQHVFEESNAIVIRKIASNNIAMTINAICDSESCNKFE